MMPYRAVLVSTNTPGVWIEAGARHGLPQIVFVGPNPAQDIDHKLQTTWNQANTNRDLSE